MPWTVPSDFSRGMQSAGFVSDAVKQIQTAIDQAKMDKVANALLNTGENAPRAEMVGWGKNPQTGQWNQPTANVNWQGTAPRTGGLQELSLRDKVQEQNVINQLRQAQTAEAQAKALEALRKPTTTGLTPYQQLQEQHYQTEQQRLAQERDQKHQDELTKAVRTWQEKNAQTLETLAKEVDTKYGKGAAEDFFNSWSNGTLGRGDPDPANPGSFIYNPNGQFYYTNEKTDASGTKMIPSRSLKTFEFEDLLRRKKMIEDAGGRLLPAPRADLVNPNKVQQVPPANSTDVNKPLASAQPLPTKDSPEAAKLPHPQTQEDYDALPPGAMFVDRVDNIPKYKQ